MAIAAGVFGAALIGVATTALPAVATALTAMKVALDGNPILLAATAIAAVAAGVVAFGAILDSQKTEYQTWTNATRKQYDELQKLNAEYETAVAKIRRGQAGYAVAHLYIRYWSIKPTTNSLRVN